MITLNNLTIKQFKALTGIHITENHTGKMNGLQSLSTSCTNNPFCIARSKNNNSICSHCFSFAQMKRYKNMQTRLEKNTELLTQDIYSVDIMPVLNCLYFRFEAFGDLVNDKQVVNYFNLCLKNPKVNFALWTKNPWIIQDAIDNYNIEKPNNLNIIFSSYNLDEPVKQAFLDRYPFIDKVFTVYTKQAYEKVKRENAYRNKYNQTHYQRIATTFPLGTKERIQASGDSLNNFVKTAVMEKLERMGL